MLPASRRCQQLLQPQPLELAVERAQLLVRAVPRAFAAEGPRRLRNAPPIEERVHEKPGRPWLSLAAMQVTRRLPTSCCGLGALLVQILLAPVLLAQGAPRLIEGTVRDDLGAAIVGARVRLEVCSGPRLPAILVSELANAPLPMAQSTPKGTFAFVMAPVHDRFDWLVHGQLALVVEAEGCQPWRELLPNPPRFYTGSDVTLPRLRDEDLATVRVAQPPADAFVRLRRVHNDTYLLQGGAPPNEVHDLPVPADGVLRVQVPLVPNPPALTCTDMFAAIGWTAQLIYPGRTSIPRSIGPSDTVVFELPAAPPSVTAALDPDGGAQPVSRCLHRLDDGHLRWFPALDGRVVDDERLPVVAIECQSAAATTRILPWPGPVPSPPPTPTVATLRCVTPAGAAVASVRISLFAPEQLVWGKVEQLRPWLPAAEQFVAANGTIDLPVERHARVSAWVTAPAHVPQLVLDVRELVAPLVLQPAGKTATVQVVGVDRTAIEGAHVYSGPAVPEPARASRISGPWLLPDGNVPTTDADGVCVLPATDKWPNVHVVAADWQFAVGEYDADGSTLLFTGTPMRPWRARVLDAAGAPVPFATVGAYRWQQQTGGGSQGSFAGAMADSRGWLVMLGEAANTPQVRIGEFGGYDHGGPTTTLAADTLTEVRAERAPFVAIRIPAAAWPWLSSVLGWRGVGRSLNGQLLLPPSVGAVLVRWPASLPLWVFAVDDGPPIVVSRTELTAQEVQGIDRRRVVREVPLRLLGDVPDDLSTLRSAPKAIAGLDLDALYALPGDYLRADRTALALQTRDLLDHEVWLLHPDALPATVPIAAGPAGTEPVPATLQRGAPCTLAFRLSQPLGPHQRATLSVRMAGRRGKANFAAAVTDPRLYAAAATAGIELRTPFALPAGTMELRLDIDGLLAKVTVDGVTPLRVELRNMR
jgi:hypothetical protein